MSSDRAILPSRWFVLVAAVTLLLAAAAAALLLMPHRGQTSSVAPDGQAFVLKQFDADGLVVPWGTTPRGDGIRLEISGLDLSHAREILFRFARNDEAPQERRATKGTIELKHLPPGHYRWTVDVEFADDRSVSGVPPRGDPQYPDFAIADPTLELPTLEQLTLDGSPLPPHGSTAAGADLGATLPANLAGAVLEIEVKPAAAAFDGKSVQRVPAHQGRIGFQFSAAPGDYHWRARITAPGNKANEWQSFGRGGPDFTLTLPAPPELPPLQQQTVSGEDLPAGGTAQGAVDLGADMPNDFPGTTLEIEVKPADTDFDGTATQQAAAHEGRTSVRFKAPPGDYHWQARFVAAGQQDGEWRAFGTDGADFTLQPNEQSDDNDSDGGQGQGGGGPSDGKLSKHGGGRRIVQSYASGLGGGSHEPLPSRVRPLPSLWHLALYRLIRIFGVALLVLAPLLLIARLIRRRGARKS